MVAAARRRPRSGERVAPLHFVRMKRRAPRNPGSAGPIVIGLAGGIGSGKSAVARAFAGLGCVVIDSDEEAHAAIDRPDVRDELKRWWGPAVIGTDGRIDRARVAQIVFRDETQRRRLEGLVHPLLRTTRASIIEEARRAGAPAVILDAPLLYEAGLEGECDVVVFVAAPREERLERVRRSRGWDEAELDRREKNQMPLELKMRDADHVLSNASAEADLVARVAEVFDRLLNSRK